jgi:SAM-dependent methyltransferase
MAFQGIKALMPEQRSRSFNPAVFARLFELEGRHFWFRARNEVIAAVMKRLGVGAGREARILEVGCGNGNVASYLSQNLGGQVWGGDLFAEALAFCRRRSDLPFLQLDTCRLPFNGSLDAVCMFDVLEHLEADSDILAEVHRALKPGGRIVLTVPAHPWLWSYFDQVSHHQRRYRKDQLRQKLLSAGFDVEMCSYYMMVLMPLVLVGRRFQAWKESDVDRMADADLRVIPVVNEILYRFCGAEKWWVSRVGLPTGTSIIAVGRRN